MGTTALLRDAPRTLREASASSRDKDLARKLEQLAALFEHQEMLTAAQAAELLGVSSTNTVKNWLKGGSFPGATKTKGGHFRFPLDEVLAAKEEMQRRRDLNRSGKLEIPDLGDEVEFPL